MRRKRRRRRGPAAAIRRFYRRQTGLAVTVTVLCVALVVTLIVAVAMNVAKKGSGQGSFAAQSATTVPQDTVKPSIIGAVDHIFTLGDTISYMKDVTATDDVDGEVDVEVDRSAVKEDTVGSYDVIYSAVDKAGNRAETKVTFTIKEPETQAPAKANAGGSTANEKKTQTPTQAANLKELAKSVVARITTNSMSTGEKLRAIYDYAHNSIGYYGNPCYSETDIDGEALHAIQSIEKNGSVGGDCVTYAAVDKALLDALGGVQMIWMENEGSSTGEHVWLLVNVGTGWYHFDSTRMYDKFVCFMRTDDEVAAKSNYTRDKSKYPASATTPYSY